MHCDRQIVRVRHVEPAQELDRRQVSRQSDLEKHPADRVQTLGQAAQNAFGHHLVPRLAGSSSG